MKIDLIQASPLSFQRIRQWLSLGLLATLSSSAFAATLTWTTGDGGDGLWSNTANWGGATVASNDNLTFGNTTGTTTLNFNMGATVNRLGIITFNSNAPAYTISGDTLTSTSSPDSTGTSFVVNSASGVTQTINMNLTLRQNGATVTGAGDLALGGTIIKGGTWNPFLVMNGTGTLTLNGSSAMASGGSTNAFQFNSGTVILAKTTAGAISGASMSLNGGTMKQGAANQMSGNGFSLNGGTFDLGGFDSGTAGNTTVGMTLRGTGGQVVNNAATNVTNTLSIMNSANSYGGTIANGNATTALAVTSNSANVFQALSGNNTFTGGSTLSANGNFVGILSIANMQNIGASGSQNLTFDAASTGGSYLQITGTDITNSSAFNSITFNTGKVSGFDIADSTNTFALSNAVNSGAGSFFKRGAGTLVMTANNTYTGATNINGGILKVDYQAGGALDSTSTLTFNGGTLYILGKTSGTTAQTLGVPTLNAGGGYIVVDANGGSGTTLTLGNIATLPGAGTSLDIRLIGTGNTVNIGSSPTTNGLVGNGRVIFRDSAGPINFANRSGTALVAAGATVGIPASAGSSTTNYSLLNAGNVTATESINSLKVATSAVSQALTVDAGQTLTLTSGAILFVGGHDYSVTGGTLKSNTATNSDLIIHQYGTGNLTIGSVIANGVGASTLTKAGSGTLVLSGTNTYTGQTYVNGGTLSISANNQLGAVATGATLNLFGGTLQATANVTLDNGGANKRAITIGSGGGGFDVTSTNVLTVTGAITATGELQKSGTGILLLSAANTLQGGVRIQDGILRLGIANALDSGGGPTSALVFGSTGGTTPTLQLNGVSTSVLSLVGSSNAVVEGSSNAAVNTLTVYNGADNTFGGIIRDGTNSTAFSLAKSGAGKLTLSNASNTFTGGTTIYNGILEATQTGTLGTGAITLANGTLKATGLFKNAISSLAGVSGAATSYLNNTIDTTSGNASFSGVVSGAGALNKTGANTLLFGNSANTYTGALTVSGGTLVVGSAGSLTSVTVAPTANLTYAASGDNPLTIAGNLAITTGNTSTVLGASIGTTATKAQINVTGNATIDSAAVTVDIYGVSNVTHFKGLTTLLHGGASSTINNGTYTLGTVYNNTDFTVGAFTTTATDLKITTTTATALTTAYWKGGLSGNTNVWAASNGSTASNWTASAGGAVQALTPGSAADVFISANSPTTAPTATVLGADMTIKSLTISDTGGLTLNDDGHKLTFVGAAGITMNAGAGASIIAPNLVLTTSAPTWTNNSANTLTVSGNFAGQTVTVAGTGNTTLTGSAANAITMSGAGQLTLSGSGSNAGALTVNTGTVLLAKTSGGAVANGITLNGGTVKLGAAEQFRSSPSLTLNGGTFDLNGYDNALGGNGALVADGISGGVNHTGGISQLTGLGGRITNNAAGTGTNWLVINETGGNQVSYGGTISDGATAQVGVTVVANYNQSAFMALAGNNTYSGGTFLQHNYTGSGGRPEILSIGSVASIGSAGSRNLTFKSGASDVNAVLQITGTSVTNSNQFDALTFTSGQGVGFDIADPNNTFTLGQNASGGNITMTGGIFEKLGAGTLVISTGGLSSAGSTYLGGGTLKIDAQAGGVLAATSAPTFSGGNLYLLGKTSGTTTQTLGNVSLGALNNYGLNSGGTSMITVDANGGSGTTLALGTLPNSTSAGYTLNIKTLTGGQVSTTTTTTTGGTTAANGMIGTGRIVFTDASNAVDFAGISASGANRSIQAATYTAGLPGSGSNSTLAYSQSDNAAVTASESAYALKLTTTTGSQALTIDPAATLTLTTGGLLFTGANDYSITGGTLKSNTATASDLIIHQYGTGNLTIGSVIANGVGASTLTKAGPGLLVLSGNNTYTGSTYITGGTLSINNNNQLGAVATGATLFLYSGGILQSTANVTLNNGGSNSRAITIGSSGGGFDVTTGNTLTITGVIGATGMMTKSGAGTLVLGNSNALLAGLTISDGIVQQGVANAVSNRNSSVATSNLIFGNGTTAKFQLNNFDAAVTSLVSSNTNAIVENGSGSAGTKTLIVVNGADNTFAGILRNGSTGLLALAKSGGGTLTLSNASNTFTGGLTIYNSTVEGTQTGTLGSGTITLADGTLKATGTFTNAVTSLAGVSGAAASYLNNTINTSSGNASFSGVFSGSGALNKTGANTLTLSLASNTYTGVLTATSGTVSFASMGSTAALTMAGGNFTSTGTTTVASLVVNAAGALAVSSNYLTVGALTGSNALTVTGGNAYTSGLKLTGTSNSGFSGTINTGASLYLANEDLLGTNANALTMSGGLLRDNGSPLTIATHSITLTGSITLSPTSAAGDMTITGGITGTGGVTYRSQTSRAIVLGGTNSYSGTTGIYTDDGNNSTLRMGAANALPSGTGKGNLELAAWSTGVATLDLNGNSQTVNGLISNGTNAATKTTIDNVTAGGNVTLTVGAGNATGTTFAGVIRNTTGTVSLEKIGTGTQTLTGANTYAGGTTVNQGTLTVSGSGTLGATTGSLTVSNNNTGAGTSTVLNLSTSADTTVGTLSGTLATPSSGTNIATINTQTGRSLTVNQTSAGTYAGVIAGSGSVTLGSSSTNTLTLTGANTYTGTTTVAGGSLQVGSSGVGTTGTGAVTVQSGSTILGSGVVRGTSFTADSGSTLQAGDSTAASSFGTLNFTPASSGGTLSLQGSIILGIGTANNLGSIDALFDGNDVGTAGYIAYVNDVSRSQGLGAGGHDLLSFNNPAGGGGTTLNFLTTTGSLQVLGSGFTAEKGQIFNLIDWGNFVTTSFTGFSLGSNYRDGSGDNGSSFDLPTLSGGLLWDVSQFTTSGIIIVVPEPCRALLMMLGFAGLMARRRRGLARSSTL